MEVYFYIIFMNLALSCNVLKWVMYEMGVGRRSASFNLECSFSRFVFSFSIFYDSLAL
jgi:hypothetical protein